MGSFLGHLVPGTFFILFSLWWIYSIFRRYYLVIKFHPNGIEGYRNTVTFPCHIYSRSFHAEGYLKIIFVIIGITGRELVMRLVKVRRMDYRMGTVLSGTYIRLVYRPRISLLHMWMEGEVATAFKDGHWAYIGNAQHITMFAFFGISGITDVLTTKKGKVLPPNLDYAAGFLAFAAEGFLFYNHLHGRTPMDVQVHMLLFWAIVGCILSSVFEAHHRNNVIAGLSRAYFTLLQGTWLNQVGFILYPPFSFLKGWNQSSHEQMMIITMMFTWHAAFHIAVIMVAAFWVKIRVDKSDNADEEYPLWVDNSAPLYKKLRNIDNEWMPQYKDPIEEPEFSRRNEKYKSEIIDSDLEAL